MARHKIRKKSEEDAARRYPEIAVGSPLWKFEENRRKYHPPAPGRTYGERDWRGSWARWFVRGETSRSWLVLPGGCDDPKRYSYAVVKIPKAALRDGKCPNGWLRAESDIDEWVWMRENRYELSRRLDRCVDPAAWREVEVLLDRHGL